MHAGPVPDTPQVRDACVDGPHGPVPVRCYYQPEQYTRTGLVWVHGGGFVGGDLDMPEADWVARQLAQSGIVVVSVDYRLTTVSVRFPVPSDDVQSAFVWVGERLEELGVDPAHLHLGGASAGANLAASVALRLRDEGGTTPASVLLAYPIVHPVLPRPSAELAAKTAVLPARRRFLPEDVASMSLLYAGREEMDSGYAFPGLAALANFPPTLIINSDADDLRASGEAMAAALATAGTEVHVVRENDTMHGHLNNPDTLGARRSLHRMINWLTTHPSRPAAATGHPYAQALV